MKIKLQPLEKVQILKRYEKYCYQVAMYLLENEQMALKACIQTLFHMGCDEYFFNEDEQLQKKKIKHLVMKNCLNVKKQSAEERKD